MTTVYNIAITGPDWGYEDWAVPWVTPGSDLCSLRTIRANWEQIWARGPEHSQDPIWGRWARGALKWTLPLSCDIGWWSPAWSAPGDFLQNFILIKSSHPEQISKSAHCPRSPSDYINISSHQRFMSRVIIFPGWFLLFSTTTRFSRSRTLFEDHNIFADDSNPRSFHFHLCPCNSHGLCPLWDNFE